MADVLLISTYELGHQPFGLASPAAWLKAAGARVTCLDLAVQELDEASVRRAGLIALYVPMHTATRLAAALIPRLKSLNPDAHLCAFGLYASTNASYLRQLGVDTLFGGEFETGIVSLYESLTAAGSNAWQPQTEAAISLDRQRFLVPDRSGLPGLASYAKLLLPDESQRWVGYTEASRGCKYRCRHCPIVPVYNGRFRIVQSEVVLADIRQQVAAGAEHITFGDPDFFNGPGQAIPLVKALQAEFPGLTYDVTIKVEHLIKYDHHLPVLRDTGCLFITSAVESVDDLVLERFDKGHTRADFEKAVRRLRALGLELNPTFVAFTPWIDPAGYLDFLSTIRDLGLIGNVAPIQYAIRLLIPAGSRLLELDDIKGLVGPFNRSALSYPWQHPNPAMDQLYAHVFRLVQENQMAGSSHSSLFRKVWDAAAKLAPERRSARKMGWELASRPIPRLSESWY